MRLVEFFCAALIPFLEKIVTEETGYLKVVIGLLGVVVAAITAAQSLSVERTLDTVSDHL